MVQINQNLKQNAYTHLKTIPAKNANNAIVTSILQKARRTGNKHITNYSDGAKLLHQLQILKEQQKLSKYHPPVFVLYLLPSKQYNPAEIQNKSMLITVIKQEMLVSNSMWTLSDLPNLEYLKLGDSTITNFEPISSLSLTSRTI